VHQHAMSLRECSKRDAGVEGNVVAVLGAQWGDEGKGKLVDVLAADFDIVARFNGGNNAGHTIVVDKVKYAFHLLPCGLLYPKALNVIGNGVVVHIPSLFKELEPLEKNGIDWKGRLFISDRAHLVFDVHQMVDGLQEAQAGDKSIGTTKRGIGPAYSAKCSRSGLRAGDLLHFKNVEERLPVLIKDYQKHYGFEYDIAAEVERYREYAEMCKDMIVDTVSLVHNSIREGKQILVEGANAALLDIDFGTYPYVTSSTTTSGGICTGLGLPPSKIGGVIGVVKAYTTRVGEGPFPTELSCSIGKSMMTVGHEYGTTTGRPRRCGWLDLALLSYSHMLNGFASLNITKLDVLDHLDEIKICVAYKLDGKQITFPASLDDLALVEVVYETFPGWKCDISKAKTLAELPANAIAYLKRIEEVMDLPISWIGNGAGRTDMIKNF
jgi:adenylosuccinate synthase